MGDVIDFEERKQFYKKLAEGCKRGAKAGKETKELMNDMVAVERLLRSSTGVELMGISGNLGITLDELRASLNIHT